MNPAAVSRILPFLVPAHRSRKVSSFTYADCRCGCSTFVALDQPDRVDWNVIRNIDLRVGKSVLKD